MNRKVIKVLVFSGLILLLQQVSVWTAELIPAFGEQKRIIEQKDLDPAVFFYTESEAALQAEKTIRQRINQP